MTYIGSVGFESGFEFKAVGFGFGFKKTKMDSGGFEFETGGFGSGVGFEVPGFAHHWWEPTRQGPSFNNSTNFLFKVPTDGLILKGWYSTITIAVYGQLTTVPKARASPPPPPPPQQHVRQPPPQGQSIIITLSIIDLIIDVDFIIPFKIIANEPNNFGDIKNGCKPNTTSYFLSDQQLRMWCKSVFMSVQPHFGKIKNKGRGPTVAD